MSSKDLRLHKIATILDRCRGGESLRPAYWIEYLYTDGEITILNGRKSYPLKGEPRQTLICRVLPPNCTAADLNTPETAEDVIRVFEQNGVNAAARENYYTNVLQTDF